MKRIVGKLKWGLLTAVGLGCLVLASAAIWIAYSASGTRGTIAALRAAGQPTCLADLARPAAAQSDNAAAYLRLADPEAQAIDADVNTTAYDSWPKVAQEAFDRGEFAPFMVAAMRDAWAGHPGLLPLLEQAARCPEYEPGRNYYLDTERFLSTTLISPGAFRSRSRALRYLSVVQLADGQKDDALHSCTLALQLAWLPDRGAMVIDAMVMNACARTSIEDAARVLQSGPIWPAASAELEAQLAGIDVMKRFREALINERALNLQAYGEMHNSIPRKLFSFFGPGRNDLSIVLAAYEQAISAAAGPTWEWDNVVTFQFERHGLLAEQITNLIENVHMAALRVLARLRALRVLNAIKQHQQAGDLDEPVDLTKLDLTADAITDPYDGKPLRVKKLPYGWMVYAVGDNLTDDGGDVSPEDNTLDVGVQLVTPADADPANSGKESTPAE